MALLCGDLHLVVWEKDELEKEQIRGVFAIGVLATLFGYQTIKNQFSSGGVAEATINIITIFLGAFWGIYITCTAFSMTNWKPTGKKEERVLKLAKDIGNKMFLYGTIFSVLMAVILAPFIIFQSIQQNPTYYVLIAIVVGFSALILVIIRAVLKRKKSS